MNKEAKARLVYTTLWEGYKRVFGTGVQVDWDKEDALTKEAMREAVAEVATTFRALGDESPRSRKVQASAPAFAIAFPGCKVVAQWTMITVEFAGGTGEWEVEAVMRVAMKQFTGFQVERVDGADVVTVFVFE